ncbi:MAG: Thivi_2564 family membrane protein [Legionellaceae bacterium]|nr:Thivi_2564 family membrane protein [Legionellaceae bacterium]
MTILNLLVLIIIAGVLLWGVNVFIPMAGAIKSLLNFLVLVLLIIYILQFFGLVKPILPFPNIFR